MTTGMTTELPARSALTAPTAAPSTSSLAVTPRLRVVRELVRENAPDVEGAHGTAPFAGYLVLVPEGTDPAELFARHGEDGALPEIHPVTYAGLPPSPTPQDLEKPEKPEKLEKPDEGVIRIDSARHVAEVDGRELDLTFLEFALLARLVAHPHRVHSREHLVFSVWGHEYVGDGRTVDVHIARLRRKLGKAHRHHIVTVRRVGYKYVPDQQ